MPAGFAETGSIGPVFVCASYPGADQQFGIAVLVKMLTSNGLGIGTLTGILRWTDRTSRSRSANTTTIAIASSTAVAEIPFKMYDLEPGSTVTFEVVVANIGRGSFTYDWYVRGWECT